MEQQVYKVIATSGIQARSAAQLVNLASRFTSDISLVCNSKVVNMKSIMGVMSLAIGKGSEIKITVEGIDEQDALSEIDQFIQNGIAKQVVKEGER